MKKKNVWLMIGGLFLSSFMFFIPPARAMPLGTLLYRTSWRNNAYGYSSKDLLLIDKKGMITDLYTGHAGIYVGQEGGVDYVVEALPDGLVKVPAKYFVNTRAGEKLIGARIPKDLSEEQREKIVILAKNIAKSHMKYDFNFSQQKGPGSGEWTCVGFTEKLYESANIPNPNNLADLVYNPDEYAVDITPDGFDNYSTYNSEGDCFSTSREFSKINRRPNLRLPAPEFIGYDAGRENGVDRYFFIPHTQFLQPILEDVLVDIDLESDFDDETIRGKVPQLSLMFNWTFINNPKSTLRQLAIRAKDAVKSWFRPKETEVEVIASDKKTTTATKETTTASKAKSASTKKTAVKKATTAKTTTKKVAAASPASVVAKNNTVAGAQAKKETAVVTAPASKVTTKKNSDVSPRLSIKTPASITPAAKIDPVVNNYNTTVVNNTPDVKRIILIARVGSDWMELYNPNDEAIDLADEGYRLEKTKAAADPGIMIRFGNTADGSYPGGTEIDAHGSYLIASEKSEADIQDNAQAIVVNSNFTWNFSGYTIYLGAGAISSDSDSDILDKIGFGSDSNYYEGSPAPALSANGVLIRKASANSSLFTLDNSEINAGHGYDSQNNSFDFLLLAPEEPEVDPVDAPNSEDDGVATSSDPIATSSDPILVETPKIVIARIGATGDDDWIDLYNSSPEDFDLALNNYRLEKTKTASDPAIIIRVGNENDGTYPGGTIIPAQNYYRLVRDDASADLLATADAVASGNNFTFDGSGYTIYLGSDSISAPDDIDIIDAVGFGPDANYYEGPAPASEITIDGVLVRKAYATSTAESLAEGGSDFESGSGYDSNDNSFDFLLLGGEEVEENIVSGYDSPGLSHLWHFDECRGNNIYDSIGNSNFSFPVVWRLGQWGCASEQSYREANLSTEFKEPIDAKGLTFVFNYKGISPYSRTQFKLFGPSGDVILNLSPSYTKIEGLPTLFYSKEITWPADSTWHQGALVIDGQNDYWELYRDGELVHREYFQAIFSKIFSGIELSGSSGYTYIDELAIWQRALSAAEIDALLDSEQELAPATIRPEQSVPVKIHHWSFGERTGGAAIDDIGGLAFSVPDGQWVLSGHDGPAIYLDRYINQSMEAVFSEPTKSPDWSLDFWWRNREYPNDGRGEIILWSGAKRYFALNPARYRPSYYFDGNYGMISEGYGLTIPDDSSWHHLVLVYDSYRYMMDFYVDGELKYSVPQTWLGDEVVDKIQIYSAGWQYELDELSIWRGALSAEQVQ